MDFFETNMSAQAIDLAVEVLRSGRVGSGDRVRQFEEALVGTLGLANPVAVNSGTSALHLALVVAGVGPGDEVILPPQAFVGSAFAVLMCGARPVFCDIQPDTGNLDPAALGSRINGATKAVMPVHWGGYPCDLDEIGAVAARHGLTVVEDAAHALGATYRGRPIGTVSRFTAFSFGAIKHLTTGDGGALCCSREEDSRDARRRRWFGVDVEREKQGIVASLDVMGFRYPMNDLAASLGLGNLPSLPKRLERRREVASRYREHLADVPGLTQFAASNDRESACWLFSVLVERRDDFIKALASRGVPAKVVEQRIDRNKIFAGHDGDLPGQAAFDARNVSLPLTTNLSEAEIDQVVAAVRAGW